MIAPILVPGVLWFCCSGDIDTADDMFSDRTPWTSAPTLPSQFTTPRTGKVPWNVQWAQSTRMCGPTLRGTVPYMQASFLEWSSKRDGKHVLSVDGDVARNPVKMNYRGTRTKLHRHIGGLCCALRDVGVHTHGGREGLGERCYGLCR